MRIKYTQGEKLAVITTEDGCHIGTVLNQYARALVDRYNLLEPKKREVKP